MTTLVATPSASDANSYCDVKYADAYFATRLGSSDWAEADKVSALIQSTRILDSVYDYPGEVDFGSTQALRWPRSYVVDRDGREIPYTIVPDAIKRAVCELALFIARSGEYSAEVDNTKAVRVGPIRIDNSANASTYSIPSTVMEIMTGWGSFVGTASGSMIRTVPLLRT